MINLRAPQKLQAVLADAPITPLPVTVSFSDKGETYEPALLPVTISGTSAVDICAAPAADVARTIGGVSIVNPNAADMAIVIRLDVSGTAYQVVGATLAQGETLGYTHSAGWYVNTADGSKKTGAVQDLSSYATHTEVAVVQSAVDAHIVDSSSAHAASAISNTPAGNIAASNVQAALNELDTEKASAADLTSHTANTSNPHSVTAAQAGAIATSALDTDGTLAANSDAKVPSQKAVKTYADQLIASADAMVFKGVVDCSANPNYPAADRGWTYRVSVAGKIGGASGVTVEVGDILLCLTDSTASGNQATVGTSWSIAQTNVDGAVIGPASATDNRVAFFDGASGKLIKDSGLTLSGGNTGDETAARIATLHHAASAKPSIVDSDEVTGGDSASGFSLIRTTWTSVKAFLKTYFDTLYALIGAVGSTGITMSTGKLLGRWSASTGAIQEVTISTGLALDGSGNLTATGGGLTIGTTAIASGTTTRLLYDLSGVVQESTATTDSSGNITIPSGAKLHLNAADQAVAVDFGGSTNSFPALRRNGAGLEAVTAALGAFATFKCEKVFTNSSIDLAGSAGVRAEATTGYCGFLNNGLTAYGGTVVNQCRLNATGSATTDVAIGYSAAGVAQIHSGTLNTRRDLELQCLRPLVFTVATLPSASTQGNGARSHVSDASAPTFGATVSSGGAVSTPVFSDATNWKVG
jgi:hypothetical protein